MNSFMKELTKIAGKHERAAVVALFLYFAWDITKLYLTLTLGG